VVAPVADPGEHAGAGRYREADWGKELIMNTKDTLKETNR
jgi:hypothetical protein